MILSFAISLFSWLSPFCLVKSVSVAGLVIRYVAILCHRIPKLLGNTSLKDNGDGIAFAFRAQRYGIGQWAGKVHDLTGHRTDHGSRRDGNDRCYRRDICSYRQLDSDGSGTLVDHTIHTQNGEACDFRGAGGGRITPTAALGGDRLAALIQHGNGIGAAGQIVVAAQRERGSVGKVHRNAGGR